MNHINNHQLAVTPNIFYRQHLPTSNWSAWHCATSGSPASVMAEEPQVSQANSSGKVQKECPFTPFTSLSHGCRLMLLSYVFDQSLQIQNLRAMWSFLGPRTLKYFFTISITHHGGAGQVWPAPLSTLAWHWHLS